jgi:hypothetical protein
VSWICARRTGDGQRGRRDRARPVAALGIGSGAGVLRALARQHDIIVTPAFVVMTPSGGWLLCYTAPGRGAAAQHPSRHRKTDTRAHGGYVVAPGCPVPPGGYDLVDDRDPAELPGWLHQALTPKPPTAPAVTNPSSGLVLRFGEQLDT